MNQTQLNEYMDKLNTRFDKQNQPYNHAEIKGSLEKDMFTATGSSISPVYGEPLEASIKRFYEAGWSCEQIADNLFITKTADKAKMIESPSYQSFCSKVAKIVNDLRNQETKPKKKK